VDKDREGECDDQRDYYSRDIWRQSSREEAVGIGPSHVGKRGLYDATRTSSRRSANFRRTLVGKGQPTDTPCLPAPENTPASPKNTLTATKRGNFDFPEIKSDDF